MASVQYGSNQDVYRIPAPLPEDHVPPSDCCWHGIAYLTSNPPILVNRCCWCGTERRTSSPESLGEHGPHV